MADRVCSNVPIIIVIPCIMSCMFLLLARLLWQANLVVTIPVVLGWAILARHIISLLSKDLFGEESDLRSSGHICEE